MRFNDLNLNDWKNCDINTDSLWIISSRDKSGKHKNIYHGNFIPQIPYQLICRYTNRDDLVLDPFIGSGTTLYECEKLNRKCIGLDINENILEFILDNFGKNFDNSRYFLGNYDNTDKEKVKKFIEDGLKKLIPKIVNLLFYIHLIWILLNFQTKRKI